MPEVTADQYNQDTGMFTCAFCKEYTGERRQVQMHSIHCQKRTQAEADIIDNREEEDEMVKAVVETPPSSPSPARRERIPFGVPQQRLDAPSDPNFFFRYFNDGWSKEPGRIQRALNAGYEVVEGRTPMTVGANEDGTPIKGVLMRIPMEFHLEDQKLKMKEVDKVDHSIKKGTVEQQAGDNRYTPQGIRIWSSHNENR